jgi:hypothetical protein
VGIFSLAFLGLGYEYMLVLSVEMELMPFHEMAPYPCERRNPWVICSKIFEVKWDIGPLPNPASQLRVKCYKFQSHDEVV